jgi:hypothetical protein
MPSDRAFSDIQTHWAKACILALAQRNLVQGYSNGTFGPESSLTRAEFAALMYRVFSTASSRRNAIAFPDVPASHWAYQAVQWGYTRGFFSGYPDGSFQPNQAIPRMQVVVVLVTAVHLSQPSNFNETLQLYFDDNTEIPDWTRWAIAAATQANLIANYPDVRRFLPTKNATRGEVAAFLCRALAIPNTVPPQYATWNLGIYDIKGTVTVPFEMWQGSARLFRDIQVLLSAFQLYPADEVNGQYDSKTEQGLTEFCNFYGLPNMQTGVLDQQFAQALITASPVDYVLAIARDRQQVFNDYYQQQAGFNADKLAFLDRGIQASPYQDDIPQYPARLNQKPNGSTLVSLGDIVVLSGTGATVTVGFSPYPNLGEVPEIAQSLDFLHPDIQQACVCVGSFVDGKMAAHWLGRAARQNTQLWSATKILPLLNVVTQANAVLPGANVRDCLIRPAGTDSGYGFYNLAVDLVSYGDSIATSNSLAALFKQFSTPTALEDWVKNITGNYSLEFQGRYGEPPFIDRPELWSQTLNRVLLTAPYTSHTGNNLVSPYDLTRIISMLGWHNHLSPEARLPNAQWNSLETVVRAMGNDTARYLDVAIDKLGLTNAIQSPVIISKLGFGRSSSRDRTELVYTALLWLIDQRPQAQGKPAVLRTIAMTLLAARDLNDANQEATQLDARMAAEVTEILRRIVTQELA